MYVAKEKTLWAKVFNTITAKEHETPIKTLDKKINCFGVINDCPKAMMLSNLLKYFFSILFVKVRETTNLTHNV